MTCHSLVLFAVTRMVLAARGAEAQRRVRLRRAVEEAAAARGVAERLEPTKAPIAEQEFIVLSARDRPVFFDTLVNPPAPSERLQRAFAQRERRVLR